MNDTEKKVPKKRAGTWIKAVIGVIALVGFMMWAGGFFHPKTDPGVVAYQPGLPIPADADWFTLEESALPPMIEVVGTAASQEKIQLSARISAYVSEVFVSAGDHVKKGQVLITLDDREVREQLTAAEAQLEQAETEFTRTKALFDQQAATQQALTAAESGFRAARAQVEQVHVMRSYASITAPIDGVVTERRIEVGDLANPGLVLLAVYDPARMRMEAPVPVRLIDRMALGDKLEVRLDRPQRPLTGEVTEIVSEVDPHSRTQRVKLRLADAGGEVLPGTFGRFTVPGEPRPTLLAPATAVYRMGQLEFAQVRQENRVVRRAIRTGPRRGDQVEILSGLKAGDRILTQPVLEG